MSVNMDTLKTLRSLGFAEDEARVYLAWTEIGATSVLALSHQVNLPRTTLYRVIERLERRELVTFERFGRREKVLAQPPRALERFLDDEQRSLDQRRTELSDVVGDLLSRSARGGTAKAYFYNGQTGLEQVTRNSTAAVDELLIFEVADLNAFLDVDSAENVRRTYVNNKIQIRELTNLKRVPAWTGVSELWQQQWMCRFIDPHQLKMSCECMIYNDVVAFYRFEDEIFCVEVHSRAVAQMQRQLFEFVWSGAQPMKIGRRGTARIG